MNARHEVLARIRTALGPSSPTGPPVPRHYRTAETGPLHHTDLPDLLTHRLVDYRATVLRCDTARIQATITDALTTGLGAGWSPTDVVVAPGLPTAARPDGLIPDDGRPASTLAQFAAAVTGIAVAVAETGTLILDASPPCGRRALSLLPDCLVCLVHPEQIVTGVPAALTRLDPRAPITMISGPSATSDIELSRVEGVHGPRTLLVVLAG